MALAGVAVSLVALQRLSAARRVVVDRADPALVLAGSLQASLLDEETGVRGYALARRPTFLAPYRGGVVGERRAIARLDAIARTGDVPALAGDLRGVAARAAAWRRGYAAPAIAAIGSGRAAPSADAGRARFDLVRVAVARLRDDLARARADQRTRLRHAATAVGVAVVLVAALLLAAALAVSLTLRAVVTLPLSRLGRDARRIARGDFAHTVAVQGPRDIVDLSSDVDAMRRRIVEELRAVQEARAKLAEQAAELERSNAELEQFAYVASHDLQEPLRKIASFCGMLQHRYGGQLDERADQYIGFAVDGARRMQALINDLLELSRVGRSQRPQALVSMQDVLADAQTNLAAALEETGATVTVHGTLPTVRGDRPLLTALLQNLIGNAVKFRGDRPPRVAIGAQRGGDRWTFSIDDEGIGIAPRHAERIFTIFQRLEAHEDAEGTGIGLALCRKIVEHHGGTIWLERDGEDDAADASRGARFRFTLPAVEIAPLGP